MERRPFFPERVEMGTPWPALRRMLSHPRAAAWAALLAVMVSLPSLSSGLVGDDHDIGRLARQARPFSFGSIDLFALQRNPSPHHAMQWKRAVGTVPWYTRDDFQISFFRPISSFTHWLDHRFFASHPWVMHAESIAWYAVAVLAVGALYARVRVSALSSGLGAGLYAVSLTHLVTVVWLANRNALLATAFGAFAIVQHDRWTRDRKVLAAPLALAAFVASLGSAELGVSTLAYLVAHALFLDPGRPTTRLVRLSPYVVVLVLFRAGWSAMGYGVRGSALYLDPLSSPVAFARAVAERAPILLGSVFGAPHADWVALVPPRVAATGALLSVLAVSAAYLVFRPLLSTRASRFFATGMLLSLVPVCAVQASDRNLMFVSIGAMALSAQPIAILLGDPMPHVTRLHSHAMRELGVVLAILLAFAPPLVFPLEVLFLRWSTREEGVVAAGKLFGAAGTAKGVVVLRGRDMFSCSWQVAIGAAQTRKLALCLTAGPTATRVRRLDDHTLEVRPDGGFLDAGNNLLFWDGHAAEVGEAYRHPAFRAVVTEVTAGGDPLTVAFRFDGPLDHPDVAWVVFRNGGYDRVRLPSQGQTLRVSRAGAYLE